MRIMGMTILLLVLHIACTVLYIWIGLINPIKKNRILCFITAGLWALCAILDVIKLIKIL